MPLTATPGSAVYTYYAVCTTYRYDGGVLQVPVAGPPEQKETCEIVNVGKPTMVKVVEWAAQRAGSYPAIPDPTPTDPYNEVLATADVQPFSAELTASGQEVWKCRGVYTYFLKRGLTFTEGLPIGLTPVEGKVIVRKVTNSDLKKGQF